MLRLFIENHEIELDSSVTFAVTKQFSDLSKPTDIINDWSKTVDIPATVNNNKIFGQLFRTDRLVTNINGIGINFNPYQRIQFKLLDGDLYVYSGYLKVNKINYKNGNYYYSVTLFGSLGDIFLKLKNITFDRTNTAVSETGEPYLIDGSQYVAMQINKESILEAWSKTNINYSLENSTWSDIIGWTPNNSFDEGFDNTSYQLDFCRIKTFKDTLDNNKDVFERCTGFSTDAIIKNGLVPREIGEFRSYLQQPFMFFNKFFQIFKNKAEAVTGYKVETDDWFDPDNEYYNKTVFLLNRPYDTRRELSRKDITGLLEYTHDDWDNNFDSYQPKVMIRNYTYNNAFDDILSTYIFTINKGDEYLIDLPVLQLSVPSKQITLPSDSTDYFKARLKESNGIYPILAIIADIVDTDTEEVLQTEKIFVLKEGDTSVLSDGRAVYTNGEFIVDDADHMPKLIINLGTVPVLLNFNNSDTINFAVRLTLTWLRVFPPVEYYYEFGTVTFIDTVTNMYIRREQSHTYPDTISIFKSYRSQSYVELNDFWDNKTNPFDFLLNYCKIFRILIDVDDINKTINFTQSKNFFGNYSIEDWTDRVDYNSNYSLVPVIVDKKNILFNYEDSKLAFQESYKVENKYNYGEKNLVTNYNFGDETIKLFTGLNTSITYEDNLLIWDNLVVDSPHITYLKDVYPFCLLCDTTRKFVRQFGNLYFYRGLRYFSNQSFRPVFITDDTPLQSQSENYCYNQFENNYRYPKRQSDLQLPLRHQSLSAISSLSNGKLILFEKPKIIYDDQDYSGTTTIYDNFWRDYFDEIYNIQNKQVTMRIKINPMEFKSFKFNKFVKINGQLYFINKINNYNFSDTYTDVELITVQDPKAYSKSNW